MISTFLSYLSNGKIFHLLTQPGKIQTSSHLNFQYFSILGLKNGEKGRVLLCENGDEKKGGGSIDFERKMLDNSLKSIEVYILLIRIHAR